MNYFSTQQQQQLQTEIKVNASQVATSQMVVSLANSMGSAAVVGGGGGAGHVRASNYQQVGQPVVNRTTTGMGAQQGGPQSVMHTLHQGAAAAAGVAGAAAASASPYSRKPVAGVVGAGGIGGVPGVAGVTGVTNVAGSVGGVSGLSGTKGRRVPIKVSNLTTSL